MKSVIIALSAIIAFWGCEKTTAAASESFDEDELNARIDSLVAAVTAMSLRVDSLETMHGTPAFTKYVYAGEGDPWETGGIDLPFAFENRDVHIA
mgnify:CR=1 FL=1